MKRNITLLLTMLLAAAWLLQSCRKEPGETVYDDRFNLDFVSPEYEIGASFSEIFTDKVVLFTFKDLSDGSLIETTALVTHGTAASSFILSDRLPDGEYRLLTVQYRDSDAPEGLTERTLGIHLTLEGAEAVTHFIDLERSDLEDQWAGDGSEESPFLICCPDDLTRMQTMTNHDPWLSFEGKHFRQEKNINLKYADGVDPTYGWEPISLYPNHPFMGTYDGGGFSIKKLWINKSDCQGYGLFGCLMNATIKNLTLETPEFVVGHVSAPLAGVVLTDGSHRYASSIDSCKVSGGSVAGHSGVGSIVGGVDQLARLVINASSTSADISGVYGVGGLVGIGSQTSGITLLSCSSEGSVSDSNRSGGDYIGSIGGLVGTADSLNVTACTNASPVSVTHAASDKEVYGVGGIAGGAFASMFAASTNTASVKAGSSSVGVGGLIGSSRYGTDANGAVLYGNVNVFSSTNTAAVSGGRETGGLVGESQSMVYYSYNTGSVSGTRDVGGLIAKAPLLVINGSANTGSVSGNGSVGGLAGISQFNQIQVSNNYGAVSATGTADCGGIIGVAGNNSGISWCLNFGKVTNTFARSGDVGSVAGIVGQLGDPRKYTAMDIIDIVFGSLSVAFSFLDAGFAIAEKAGKELSEVAVRVVDAVAVVAFSAEYITSELVDNLVYEKTVVPALKDEVKKIQASNIDTIVGFGSSVNPKFIGGNDGSIDEALMLSNTLAAQEKVLRLLPVEGDKTLEKICDGLSETREDAREQMEKVMETQELALTILVGIGTAATIAALIAAPFAAGAVATAFAVSGIVGGALGGACSIATGVNNFAENVCVVEQCVNFGSISGKPDQANPAGIVARMSDWSRTADCANFADNIRVEYEFYGAGICYSLGAHASLKACYNASGSSWATYGVCDSAYYSNIENTYFLGPDFPELKRFTWKGNLDGFDWKYWGIEEGKTAPYPSTSKYLVE